MIVNYADKLHAQLIFIESRQIYAYYKTISR
jgi:hypothetical protein